MQESCKQIMNCIFAFSRSFACSEAKQLCKIALQNFFCFLLFQHWNFKAGAQEFAAAHPSGGAIFQLIDLSLGLGDCRELVSFLQIRGLWPNLDFFFSMMECRPESEKHAYCWNNFPSLRLESLY